MMHQLINADCLDVLNSTKMWTTIFADPPDNIGLGYDTYQDNLPEDKYVRLLEDWLTTFVYRAKTVWFSFNAKWTFKLGGIVDALVHRVSSLEAKPCIQVFTFGQHNHHDLGNNHRPLWRLRRHDAPLLPDAVRVPSWRQEHGDKRADPRGRVPGDTFDFPRVTGNSKQRRPWHKTQLHEGLVERCVRLTTPPGESVLDPFGGTGTTLRVCKRTGNPCTLIEMDPGYCEKIAAEHNMTRREDRRATWELRA
jgi:DNA modification methylase